MRTSLPNPPQHLLKSRFDYNEKTGSLTWKTNGKEVGCIGVNGHTKYRRTRLDGILYTVHRLIWTIIYGEDPLQYEIDHKNGNGLDNRKDNLRKVTPNVNRRNLTRKKRDMPEGVYRSRSAKESYIAQVTHLGETRYLGTFTTINAAMNAVAELNKVVAAINSDNVMLNKCELQLNRK